MGLKFHLFQGVSVSQLSNPERYIAVTLDSNSSETEVPQLLLLKLQKERLSWAIVFLICLP
jgi:hypothetical protein